MTTPEAEFEHLTIRYDDRVLEPRPWTAERPDGPRKCSNRRQPWSASTRPSGT